MSRTIDEIKAAMRPDGSIPADFWHSTPEEIAEMMALQAELARERPLSPDAQWRRDYKERQRQARTIGIQHDLFGAAPVTHYKRIPGRAQAVDQRPREEVASIIARAKRNPLAAFGVEREDRPTFPTEEQKARTIAAAANWLRIGQRVMIIDAPGSVDPHFGLGKHIGRKGVVWRLCSSVFADQCYVFLDPVGAERTEKIEFVDLRDLEPIE